MKKFLFIAALFTCMTAMAQSDVKSPNELIKERKEMNKMTTKAVDQKVTKLAKKEAKALAKEGWKPGPGTMPIERQLDDLYRQQVEMKGDAPKYIIGTAQNTGDNYTAAKKAAMEFARQSVAEQISAEVAELTNTKVGNSETGTADAESVTQIVNEGKSLVQQSIGQVRIVQEISREVNGKVQVRLAVTYTTKQAKAALMKAMENASEETRRQLDEMTQDWGN